MSDDLRRKLKLLEDDYAGQPIVAQQADLREINRIRTQLGMPLVDAHLKEIGAADVAKPKPKKKPAKKEARDHTEAREIYQAYLKKHEELEVYRAYADRVVKATAGRGQTPVRPLATMGTDGGPLLCDHCGKPIVLEGGTFHGVNADVAWGRNPNRGANWTSWIFGGMVVEIQTNGTLRIYHGYPGRNNTHCCNVASREDQKARDEFESRKKPEKQNIILAFLEDEFPERTINQRYELLNKIMDTMFSYDPGLGVNRPSKES
jgi:hypothetical protein